ncbi:LINE-1 retrotransposable element ORF1 protein [Dissostichus eleginoides]|uniref:LINE-1 retrotransposable element ORF1 protein n=1 Tax=Dissostichus eleginoides TaxID=100907 RepID=A0AAD9BLA3_DISEL|nr:LINE-1 retrotransposable element ORF1 protein [Dissostichus eleginoides]
MEGNMSLQTLWDAIQQIKTDMLTHIDSKMDPIQSSLSRIHNSLSSLGDQVNLLEQRVRANEDNVQECVARVKQLEKDNSFLMSKVDDLENRSRRSNLRFIGILESAEGSDIIGFMSRLIPQLLGPDAFPTLPIIERAHRSPTARQNSRASPRAIMIELLNFQDKVKILRLARVKKSLEYNRKHISIYPDFSPELTRTRRSFDPVKRKLRELNMKFFLLYPCTLCVVVDGTQQRFSTNKDAEAIFMSTSNSPG